MVVCQVSLGLSLCVYLHYGMQQNYHASPAFSISECVYLAVTRLGINQYPNASPGFSISKCLDITITSYDMQQDHMTELSL